MMEDGWLSIDDAFSDQWPIGVNDLSHILYTGIQIDDACTQTTDLGIQSCDCDTQFMFLDTQVMDLGAHVVDLGSVFIGFLF